MGIFADVFILSTVAGLATGFGGALALVKKPGKILFGLMMGFAAGVMLELSFFKMLAGALNFDFALAIAIFAVAALSFLTFDLVLPHIRFRTIEAPLKRRLKQVGILLAIGVALHNLPEGIAVGAGFVVRSELGLLITLGIILHNIPEGIATALPLYAGGMERRKALAITTLSGLVEPIGALLAAFVLKGFAQYAYLGLAFAAGVMLFIILDELIPIAREHAHGHAVSVGILFGIIAMASVSRIFGI